MEGEGEPAELFRQFLPGGEAFLLVAWCVQVPPKLPFPLPSTLPTLGGQTPTALGRQAGRQVGQLSPPDGHLFPPSFFQLVWFTALPLPHLPIACLFLRSRQLCSWFHFGACGGHGPVHPFGGQSRHGRQATHCFFLPPTQFAH